jgi:hypothetical protein
MTVLEQESTPNRPRLRGRAKTVAVSVYLEPEMYDALVARANRTERTLSEELRRALRRHLGLKRAA